MRLKQDQGNVAVMSQVKRTVAKNMGLVRVKLNRMTRKREWEVSQHSKETIVSKRRSGLKYQITLVSKMRTRKCPLNLLTSRIWDSSAVFVMFQSQTRLD